MTSDYQKRLELIESIEKYTKEMNEKYKLLQNPELKDNKKEKIREEILELTDKIVQKKTRLQPIKKRLKFLTVPNSDTSEIPPLNISQHCKETENMVSQEPLIPEETVLLSDGHCYSLETAVKLYESYKQDLKTHKTPNTFVFKGPLRAIYNENDIKLIQKAKLKLNSLSKKRKNPNNNTNNNLAKKLAKNLREKQEAIRSRFNRTRSIANGNGSPANAYQSSQRANMEQSAENTRARSNISRRSARPRQSR